MYIAANIVILVIEAVCLYLRLKSKGPRIFIFYTLISNAVAFIAAAVLLTSGFNAVSAALRYLATCMLIMTFLVVVLVLVPASKNAYGLLIKGDESVFHVIAPVLSTVSYVLWEPHSGLWQLPVLITFVYGILMLYLNAKGKVDGPYPFFKVREQSVTATIIWMAVLTGLIAAISLGLNAIAH